MTGDVTLSEWEGTPVDELAQRWQVPRLIVLRETVSTNDVAREHADDDAPAGTVVMAEHQTAGRGRMGRAWTDASGQSLLLSFLLRPENARGDPAPGTAPVRVGIAIARALRQAARIDARLEWPNDIVVPDMGKLAGILCEAATAGGDAIVIAGIGINVHQQPDDFTDTLHRPATSVAIAAGGSVDRSTLMAAICSAMAPLFTASLEPLAESELRAWASLDSLRDRAVTARGADSASGIAAGIAPDGALLVRTGTTVRRITSATVRPADRQPSSTYRPST